MKSKRLPASLTPSVFGDLCRLASESAGIELAPGKEALVSARLAARLRALQLDEPRDYVKLLRAETRGAELVHFVDAISTNVTSFFREIDHFETLHAVAERAAERPGDPIRVWSAAAASGEEPFSAAMVLDDVCSRTRSGYRVWATDISTRALDHARAAIYTADDIAPIPDAYRARYLHPIAVAGSRESRYRVVSHVRDQVDFSRLNLASPFHVAHAPFDVIFCRNVLIYFSLDTRRRLVAALERHLRPGGLLLLGHAESLQGVGSSLQPVRPSVFVKPTRPTATPGGSRKSGAPGAPGR